MRTKHPEREHTMYRGTHVRLTLPDSTPTATCQCRRRPHNHVMDFSRYCPKHDPVGYTQYMAAHAPDSIKRVDRDPWSGRA